MISDGNEVAQKQERNGSASRHAVAGGELRTHVILSFPLSLIAAIVDARPSHHPHRRLSLEELSSMTVDLGGYRALELEGRKRRDQRALQREDLDASFEQEGRVSCG